MPGRPFQIGLLILLGISYSNCGRAAPPKKDAKHGPLLIQCDSSRLVETRARYQAGDPALTATVAALVKDADKYLTQPPLSVVDKPWQPPSGDKHDYLSLAPYFWPDPKRPDGTPYVRKDGQTNPQRDLFDEPKLVTLGRSVRTLGLAYYLTGREPYAARATILVRHWFLDPATRMNPSLKYGQFVPGVTTGRSEGILETRSFLELLDAVGMCSSSPSWSTKDQQALVRWFREYLVWMSTSDIGREEATAENNHGSWWAAQAATYAVFVGDEVTARKIVNETAQQRVVKQIRSDGSQPLEQKRTKGFDYCVFNLEALVTVATVGDRLGVDLWNAQSSDGGGLRAAIEWLLPYASGEKTWPYDQIKKPKTGPLVKVLRRAAIAYHEPRYDVLAEKFRVSDSDFEFLDLLHPRYAVNAIPESPASKASPGKSRSAAGSVR